jgi:hypothetical protein
MGVAGSSLGRSVGASVVGEPVGTEIGAGVGKSIEVGARVEVDSNSVGELVDGSRRHSTLAFQSQDFIVGLNL